VQVVHAYLQACHGSCPVAEGEETVTGIVRAVGDGKRTPGVVVRQNDGWYWVVIVMVVVSLTVTWNGIGISYHGRDPRQLRILGA